MNIVRRHISFEELTPTLLRELLKKSSCMSAATTRTSTAGRKLKSTTPLSARWTCPTNKPDLSGAVRKRRTGTAKFFTLLLLPYLTTAKSQGMKQLMAGAGVAIVGMVLVPLLSGLFTV